MTRINLTEIGQRIKDQRKALGLTQQDVYEKIDVSQNHYSRIENGHTGMSFEILVQLSEILGVTADYILTGRLDTSEYPDFVNKYSRLTQKQKKLLADLTDSLIKHDLK